MERTMSFSDWVAEYKPIEVNSISDHWFKGISSKRANNLTAIKEARGIIGKYLIRFPELEPYPIDHVNTVYIETSTNSIFFWYTATKKPMAPIDRITIEEPEYVIVIWKPSLIYWKIFD